MLVDLEQQLKFPSHITITNLRQDIVFFESTKKVIMLLGNWSVAASRQGGKARCLPIEVKCRGFTAKSLSKDVNILGIVGNHRGSSDILKVTVVKKRRTMEPE